MNDQKYHPVQGIGLVLVLGICFAASEIRAEDFSSSENTAQNTIEAEMSPFDFEPVHTARKNEFFEVGTQLYYFDYKESNDRPGFKSEERAVLPALSLAYSFGNHPDRPVFGQLNLSYTLSDVLYDGSLQTGTPMMGTSELSILTLQTQAGYYFLRKRFHELGVYSGLNLRRWDRKLDKTKKSPFGSFDEVYSTLSIPLGARWNYLLTDQFHFSVDASLGIPIVSRFKLTYPKNKLAPESVSLANSLSTNVSWKVQAPVTYWHSKNLSFSLTPFMESISYNLSYIGSIHYLSSGIIEKIYEPDSQTYQYGTHLKVALGI